MIDIYWDENIEYCYDILSTHKNITFIYLLLIEF